MFQDEECGHFIDPSSGYCPQENRRKKQKTKPKPKEQSSQASNTIPSTQEDRSNPTFLPATSIDNLTPNVQRGGLFVPTNSSSGGQTTAHLPSFSSSVPSRGFTVNNLISPNTVSQNDEKPHTAELDDTAIPHVKVKITEISHLPPSLAFIFSRSFFLRTAPHYLNAWNRLVFFPPV